MLDLRKFRAYGDHIVLTNQLNSTEGPWTETLFGTSKPVIAMCHFQALPGDPYFDGKVGIESVVESARKDLQALQRGGVDAVMFSNEFSLPYVTKVSPVTIASMARIIGQLLPDIEVPFGVNVLWDPIASIDLAAATGASFIREIFTGVYASDFGLWNTDCGNAVRHLHALGIGHVKLLFNIVPEAAAYLGERGVAEIARSTVFNTRPDGLCVSGLTAGAPTDSQTIKTVKDAVPTTVVFANTGVNAGNVAEQLAVADGAVVGTTFKKDGVFENSVDKSRVSKFMGIVRSLRS
jgi:uncharacterized protein